MEKPPYPYLSVERLWELIAGANEAIERHQANEFLRSQYEELRERYLAELNEIFKELHLKVLVEA